ncbi:hypothetical protein C0989_012595 [Termitomyces sp. Mn162]|nr:hypothetical protein C0989_012595 [Termitomyces sp. Mn162]
MSYIKSGKQEGATVDIGGARHGQEGYFIQPTIFTNVKPEMKIVKEEIFGPVGVVFRMEDQLRKTFGGYRQSGIGHDLGEYALNTYTQVKAVHVNIGQML